MPGILYVVATPIGNLEDVTLRALRILREVSLVAAEDTRRTSKLLQHYSISTPTTSLHAHNEHAKAPGLVARLQGGQSIALVSDAGTPAVSDPGARLVAAAHAVGILVVAVPGASAVTAAVSAAGLSDSRFAFGGFPPDRSKARKEWFEWLGSQTIPVVFFEAPHRIERTLATLGDIEPTRRLAIGRELTKAHEEYAIRPISTWLQAPPTVKGEFVLVLFPAELADGDATTQPAPEELAKEFGRITESSPIGRREAIREVAQKFGVRTRDVFAAIERHRNSPE
jgi:16S rRNA (cytidine1402-2'-O)-methyltransferase